jgi:hypothetical protein
MQFNGLKMSQKYKEMIICWGLKAVFHFARIVP